MLAHKLTIPAMLGIVFMETNIAHVRVMETGLGQIQVALMKVSSMHVVFLIVHSKHMQSIPSVQIVSRCRVECGGLKTQ